MLEIVWNLEISVFISFGALLYNPYFVFKIANLWKGLQLTNITCLLDMCWFCSNIKVKISFSLFWLHICSSLWHNYRKIQSLSSYNVLFPWYSAAWPLHIDQGERIWAASDYPIIDSHPRPTRSDILGKGLLSDSVFLFYQRNKHMNLFLDDSFCYFCP